MKKLSLLILCLLAICKSFSQNDTLQKTKYVFLTEEQAKANIKELIAYDALKKEVDIFEKRIANFQEMISSYELVVAKQDSIIQEKDAIISKQEKIINYQKPIEFHSYAGMEFFIEDFQNPSLYFRTMLEFKKFNIGARANFSPVPMYQLPSFYVTANVEIKIH